MFGCIYQLWDWLEAPPLFTSATMDAKKFQQLQQANAQTKVPLAYQTNLTDYRTSTQSPVFHQQQQGYHHMQFVGYQQSPTVTSSSGGGPLTPIDMQPQANKLLLKHHINSGGGTTSNSSHSSPYHQSYSSGEQQLYQSPNERTYLAAAGRLKSKSAHNPATALQAQYQQLQQAKLQLQIQTQNDAMQQQQRTFALRQALNPPVPQGHYHMSQSSSVMSSMTMPSQLQQQSAAVAQHQRAPPSTLNLASQFQPAIGPLKVNPQIKAQQQTHYHQQHSQLDPQTYAQQQLQLQLQMQQQHLIQAQQQQRLKTDLQTPGNEQTPVYIQQNHPGHVVNQACQTQISAVKPGGVVAGHKNTPSSEESSGASKSPLHAPLDRKKSSGSIQLKSPVTKRPASSPVTISGWLYKQGSDGLKVWRKRWFVLAEYCLYYYKGPEEEKLLGSILLPSYKVTACSPEDKIYRKFAFKCEHTNMRTYWLAAETNESMVQWVRSLTAATMMQAQSSGGESDQMSQPSGSSSLNHSGENSDSGIHTLQSQQSKMSQGQITPASENGANANGLTSGGTGQPLYANAPPKPRRINDGGYSSPSPEHSVDNERRMQSQLMQHQRKQQLQQQLNSSRRSSIMSPTLQQMQQQQQRSQQPQQHHAIYDTRTGNVSSALRLQQAQQQYSIDNLEAKYQKQMALNAHDFSKSPTGGDMLANYVEMEEQIIRLQQQQQQQHQQHQPRPDEIYSERELYMQKLIQQRYPGHLGNHPMIADRRTPDAYGRSKNRVYSDYEDIYNMSQSAGSMGFSAQETLLQEAASYRRPVSPPSYDGSKHVPDMPSRYTPNMLEPNVNPQIGSNINLRARSSTNLVRPHSADFLEYEARAEEAASHTLNPNSNIMKTDANRTPRPKSSLDINRSSDSYHYSEASYAEKMRKSALYLQHPQHPQNQNTAQPQNTNSSYRNVGNVNATNPFGSGMHTIAGYENPYERSGNKRSETHNTATSSMPRISRATAGLTASSSSSHIRSTSVYPTSPTKQQTSPSICTPAMSTAQIIQQNEQFLRSASARLPKRNGSFDDETRTTSPTGNISGNTQQDGERKREESMKRLLEWKQRMLQSPLTRKGILQQAAGSNMTAMAKLGSNPNILLSSTTVASGAHYGPQSSTSKAGNSLVGGVAGIKRSRSETHANAGPTTGYNSYSSDDEAPLEGSNTKSPAGRLKCNPSSAMKATMNQDNIAKQSNDVSNASSECNKINETFDKIKTNKLKALQFNATCNLNIEDNDKIKSINTNKTLKPILKTTDRCSRSNNTTPVNTPKKALEKRLSLRLKIISSHNTETAVNKIDSCRAVETATTNAENVGVIPEVSILPKKPAPKSPQNIFYTPVYSTKTLTGTAAGGVIKTYNEPEIDCKVDEEIYLGKKLDEIETEEQAPASNIVELKSDVTDSIYFENTTNETDATATPILKGLQIFQKAQILQKNLAAKQVEENINKNEYDDEDENDNTFEYTDDDLDEALAEENETETNSNNESQAAECQVTQVDENHSNTLKAKESDFTEENHYLPMTPKRVETATASAAAKSFLSLLSMHDSNGEEENAYVEMCKDLKELDDDKSNYEEMCLTSAVTAKLDIANEQNKLLKVQLEPVYMELANGKPNQKLTSSHIELKQEETVVSSGKSTLKKNSKKSSDSSKKKSKKPCNKRKDLPDILKPSQSTFKNGSDSSDADDESTKQIDPKKLRSRMRFSLSDTFRPASYYLGATSSLNDAFESSDSEIVAPPPIPASPPPAEELKTEEIFSAEIYDTVKRRDSSSGKLNTSYDQIPKIHASNTSLNFAKPEAVLKSSRLSLPDQLAKTTRHVTKTSAHPSCVLLKHQHERTLSDSNYSFQTDNSSNTSSDFDLYNRIKKHSPSFSTIPSLYRSNTSLTMPKYLHNTPLGTGDSSETDSVEFRQRQNSDSELERQRSRRPLSEESISEIESLDEKFQDTMYTPDLDQYLNELQASDCYVYKSTSTNDTTSIGATGGLSTNLIKPPKIFRTKNDANFYNNMHFVSSTDSLQFTGSDSKAEGSQVSLHGGGGASLTPTKYMTPMHSRNNSNISEHSAPYYYSEIDCSRDMPNTPTTLNNQRDVHVHSGSNIVHIHNPIERHQFNMHTLADKDQAIDSKNINKLKTNVEKLSYSSTKNLKTGEPFQIESNHHQIEPQIAIQTSLTAQLPGFYIQELQSPALKLSNFDISLQKHNTALTPLRSSTPTSSTSAYTTPSTTSSTQLSCIISLNEQLIGDSAKNTNIESGNKVRLESSCGVGGSVPDKLTTGTGPSNTFGKLGAKPKSTTERIPSVSLFNKCAFSVLGAAETTETIAGGTGELLWEEDTLWRESLRRVSQRHARSLDDLDRIVPTSKLAVIQHTNFNKTILQKQTKPKITRDVTYVNDKVLRLHNNPRLNPQIKESNSDYDVVAEAEPLNELNEDDVYVQLTTNEVQDAGSDVYELLQEEETGSNISHKSAELDRETIRQWDSMSSGLMKNVNFNNSSEASAISNTKEAPTSGSVKSIIKQWNTNTTTTNEDDNSNISKSIVE